MTDLVTVDEIRAAAARLSDAVVRTPLVPFAAGAPVAGGRSLLVKPEALQPTGAFKLRGAYNAVYAVTRDLDSCAKPDGLVAHSSGTHGYPVGSADRLLGPPPPT